MDIVLIAGLWLPSAVWAETATGLERLGHRPIVVVLPGVDDKSTSATLDDQVSAVLAAIDSAETPLVVGHSAACTLAWIAADQRPRNIHGVVLIGGFPESDGQAYADFFEVTDGGMDFPGWGPFEGPDSADLDERQLGQIAADAIPVPAGVARGTVRLNSDERFKVPVVLICPEFTPEQAKAWIASGDVPEMEKAETVSFVDIDSGHWPMVTRPTELAGILAAVAKQGP